MKYEAKEMYPLPSAIDTSNVVISGELKFDSKNVVAVTKPSCDSKELISEMDCYFDSRNNRWQLSIKIMNYCTIFLTLQFCLLCRCNSKISFISGNSNNFIDILAKHQINEDFESIYSRQGTKRNDYSVVVSDDDNTDRRPKYQPQYSVDHGAAAGNYQQGQKSQQLNPLLKQASTATIGILFVLLIWRSLASYELADQFNSGTFRLLSVPPTVLILIANLMGFIINVMKPFNFKNFLKFILALNITREFIELLYNAIMLVVNSSNSQMYYI
jgi:hypothetical protein